MSRSAKPIRYALSGTLAIGLLAGCAGSNHLARAGDYAARPSGKVNRAVDLAESTVERSPNDAAARVALGQAYLDAGRFQSAATTFHDAIALGDSSGPTQLRLALAQIGAGDRQAAVDVLDGASDAIPAADRGLALALAGQTDRGVAILTDALRGGENTPKLRQNLAYAFALDGRWREARVAMAQDVPADKINDRIGEWAMMAQPEDVQKRVAALLSVPAGVQDAGQPQALALGGAEPAQQVAMAEAPAPAAPAAAGELPAIDQAPAAAPAPAPSETPVTAPVGPVPSAPSFAAAFDAQPQPQPQPEARPEPNYLATPVVQPIPASAFDHAPRVAARSAAPAAVQLAPRSRLALTAQQVFSPARRSSSGGTHLVQLGSFSSEASARRAWGVFLARNPELRNYRLVITPAVVNGRNYWRVAAAGLDGNGARHLCSDVKTRGGACFAYAATHAPAGALPAFAMADSGSGREKARR
jgi:Flp pilus assembly protein TadD